jgi:biofilm protein TabA
MAAFITHLRKSFNRQIAKFMVADRLEYSSAYFNLSPGIRTALEFLQRADLGALDLGRTSVEGDDVFALVSDYDTQMPEDRFWEAHRRHIDVQYVHTGVERIAVGNLADFAVEPYDRDRDLVVAKGSAAQTLTVAAGGFVILFPHDVHMPGLIADRVTRVRKIVVKVKIG